MTWAVPQFDVSTRVRGIVVAVLAFVTGYSIVGSGTVTLPAVGPVPVGVLGAGAFVTGLLLFEVGRRRSDDADCGCY